MADNLLVCVSARLVSAARWHNGALDACSVFPNNEDGLSAFGVYLESAGKPSVHMLANVVEEDYRLESLPHSFGSERAEMVNRKLKQFYRNTPYFSARLQGRDDDKRRDDRYLFCAITNPDPVSEWLQAIINRGLPVAGLYLLPTVIPGMVSRLQIKHDKVLTISIEDSGVRLTFLREQKLRISRFAHIDSSDAQAIKSYADEITNTRLYLHALRILTLDESLLVLIVDRNDTLAALEQTITRDSPYIECWRLARREIVSQLGISEKMLGSSSDALALHLLGLQAPQDNLAPAHVTLGYRQHQARRGIYALTGVLALSAAAWCGVNLYQIWDSKSETQIAARQTAQLQSQYLEATRQFPAAPTTADNLQHAVEVSQKIGATLRSPESMLNIISEVAELSPTITLKSVGWKYDSTRIEADAGKSYKRLDERPAPEIASIARRQSGLIEGEVRPFRGDYRGAIETINRFAEVLAKHPAVAEVNVVKLPLNISSNLALTGNTTDSADQSGKAEFKMLLVLK